MHQAVKAKILEMMAEWTEMFAKDPDLGIMEQAYMKLKSQSLFIICSNLIVVANRSLPSLQIPLFKHPQSLRSNVLRKRIVRKKRTNYRWR